MILSLADFKGRWRLSRQILDAARRETGWFAGEVVFHPDGVGLRYEETGALYLAGQPPMTATQRYLWRFDDEGIDVLFGDGRAFHRIDLSGLRTGAHPQAHHHCAPDDYLVRYDFSRWSDWSSHWQISGPRKAYELHNSFARL